MYIDPWQTLEKPQTLVKGMGSSRVQNSKPDPYPSGGLKTPDNPYKAFKVESIHIPLHVCR